MEVNPKTSAAIRDAANAAAVATKANGAEIMGAMCLMASHMAHAHCGSDRERQDQWFRDLVQVVKIHLEAEGQRDRLYRV